MKPSPEEAARVYLKLSCAGVAIFVAVEHGAVQGLFVLGYYLVCFLGLSWLIGYVMGEFVCEGWLETSFIVTLVALFFVPLAALYFSRWIYLVAAALMVSMLCLAYIVPRYQWRARRRKW